MTTTAISSSSMSFNWLLNGKKIKKDGTSVANLNVPLVGTISTLTVSGVDSDSAGTYSVQVINSAGTVTSSNALVLVVSTVVSNVVSFVASGTGKVANGFKITLSAPAGSNVVIQASVDLAHWNSLSTNTAAGGSVSFTDTAATNMNARFYRARIQ